MIDTLKAVQKSLLLTTCLLRSAAVTQTEQAGVFMHIVSPGKYIKTGRTLKLTPT